MQCSLGSMTWRATIGAGGGWNSSTGASPFTSATSHLFVNNIVVPFWDQMECVLAWRMRLGLIIKCGCFSSIGDMNVVRSVVHFAHLLGNKRFTTVEGFLS